jgi:hypothetical protein
LMDLGWKFNRRDIKIAFIKFHKVVRKDLNTKFSSIVKFILKIHETWLHTCPSALLL